MELIIYVLRSVASAIVTPPLIFVLITLMFIFYSKNKKISAMQKIIIGGKVDSSVELTLSQFVLGIIGGIAGSIILTSLGVNFNYECGIQYLFLISIILMFVKPKYICFSYSAGILGLVSIIFEVLKQNTFKIDILYLLLFIGVFHIVEGILVMIDGHRGIVPVFSERENSIIGGYALKRYWALPIAMIFTTVGNRISNSAELPMDMPSWWPLVDGIVISSASLLLVIIPFYAMVGYSSTTFTKSKREKALSSGLSIFVYGLSVILIAQVARFGILGRLLTVIYAPAAHEFMLRIQRIREERNEFKFVSNDNGLIVLDMSNDSQMKNYGVEIGDRIISVNGCSINSEKEIYSILKENLYKATIRIKKKNGDLNEFHYIHNKARRIGVLLVPKKAVKEKVQPVEKDSFQSILDHIKRVNDSPKNS